jgi:hypothetical protein
MSHRPPGHRRSRSAGGGAQAAGGSSAGSGPDRRGSGITCAPAFSGVSARVSGNASADALTCRPCSHSAPVAVHILLVAPTARCGAVRAVRLAARPGDRTVSRGPGRVQRAILRAIAEPAAAASYDHESARYPDAPGPVGVPLSAIYSAVYGHDHPTRAQHVTVDRAVRVLRARGLADSYSRPRAGGVGYQMPCEHCGYAYCHPPVLVIGRLRNSSEASAVQSAAGEAAARLRAALR